MLNYLRLTGVSVMLALAAAACSNPEADKQKYLESGNSYASQKKYAEAIIEYRNAIVIDQRFGEARYKLAEAYEASGDLPNAAREYVRAADLLPDNLDAQLKAATALTMSAQFEDAKTRVQRVIDRDPRNVQAQILLGNILAGLKDIKGAVAQIEEAIQIDPDRGASYTTLGVLKLAQGDRDAARAAFDRAIAVDAKSVDARLALAMFQLQTGDAAGAEETLKAALAIDPAHGVANRAMATLYLASNRAPEAEPFLKNVVAAAPSPQARFMLADYYAALSRAADAKNVLQPLIEQPETSADANARMAHIEYATDRAGAHARLDGVLANNPQHVPSLLMKGRWMLAEGKPQEALAHAQVAVKAAPENPATHYLLGTVQAQTHNVTAAVGSFNEVLRLNPRVAAAQLQLSRLELARGAAAEAVQLAESALKTVPGNAEARFTLAGTLIAKRDLARAEPLVAELRKGYPNVATVHALDGMLALAKKNIGAARAAYERALKLDPQSFPATAGLSAIEMLEKNSDAAGARVESRLAQSPDDVRLLLLAARVFAATNQAPKAERALRRVVELAPADSTAYGMLGQMYVSQGRWKEARAEFDAMAARDPKNVGARTLAAMLSHSTNDLEDAKTRYRAILENNPDAAVAANNLAWILAEEGRNYDEALRLAQRAVATAPDRAEIQDTLGWVYYRSQYPSLAIAPFEKSVALAPENPTYHYHLGLAHAKTGNVQEARKALETALKLNPNLAEARQLQATLR
jgi:tetratricopeptide (TPR) repeat protein